MGSSSSKPAYQPNQATAYVIPREREDQRPGAPPGYHLRGAGSLQQHLAGAPCQRFEKHKDHYPHPYRNDKKHFEQPLPGDQYSIYPSKDYRWLADQNRYGHAKPLPGDKKGEPIGPGHTRTVTNKDKVMVGVAYHPEGSKKALFRADELHLFSPPGEMHGLYRFDDDKKPGQPIRVQTAERRWHTGRPHP